jgi:hypothetical protein
MSGGMPFGFFWCQAESTTNFFSILVGFESVHEAKAIAKMKYIFFIILKFKLLLRK